MLLQRRRAKARERGGLAGKREQGEGLHCEGHGIVCKRQQSGHGNTHATNGHAHRHPILQRKRYHLGSLWCISTSLERGTGTRSQHDRARPARAFSTPFSSVVMAPSSHRSEAERRRLVMLAARVLSPLSNEPPFTGRIEAKETFFPSLFGEGREGRWGEGCQHGVG